MLIVITSYSIHYTKLYDDSKPEELDTVDRQLMQLRIEKEALKLEKDRASKDRLEQLEIEIGTRITSYNVCYTKLLRAYYTGIISGPIQFLKSHAPGLPTNL